MKCYDREQELSLCARERDEILNRADVLAGEAPAWLVTLGLTDWDAEERLIRYGRKAMAMTKAERAEMRALKEELALAKAWRLTESVEPDFIVRGKDDSERSYGWEIHSNTPIPFVQIGIWAHSGKDAFSKTERTFSHGRADFGLSNWEKKIYSRKSLALREIRHRVEIHALRELQDIDRQIAAAEAEERANG